jgi:DNA-binding transcriptional ArsR family regulator
MRALANRYLSIYLSIMFRQDAILDLAFQALADPSRRAMVDRLVQGPATVSELAKPLAMSLPGVMQHLAVLEASGLVVSEKIGRTRTCKIDPKVLSQAEKWFSERRALWERRLDRLGQFLDETKDD